MFKEFWQFVKECWQWAYGHSWAWVKWLGAVGSVGTALAFLSYPEWAKAHLPETVNYGIRAIPVLGLVVFLLRLAVAPYYLWRAMKRNQFGRSGPESLVATINVIEACIVATQAVGVPKRNDTPTE